MYCLEGRGRLRQSEINTYLLIYEYFRFEMWNGEDGSYDYDDDFDSPKGFGDHTVVRGVQKSTVQNVNIVNDININVNINGMTEMSTVRINVTEMVERNDEFTKTGTGIIDDVSKAERITEVMENITEVALSNNEVLEDNGSGNGMVIVVCIVGGVLFCVIILAVYLRYR